MRIALGADHRGFRLKEKLRGYLEAQGHSMRDFGTDSAVRTDYPGYACLVARAVAARQVQRGILVCGTGIGMSIVANRVRGVRAALCSDVRLARLSRRHNNANVLCLGGDVTTFPRARAVVAAWLDTGFEGGRHRRRLTAIDRC